MSRDKLEVGDVRIKPDGSPYFIVRVGEGKLVGIYFNHMGQVMSPMDPDHDRYICNIYDTMKGLRELIYESR